MPLLSTSNHKPYQSSPPQSMPPNEDISCEAETSKKSTATVAPTVPKPPHTSTEQHPSGTSHIGNHNDVTTAGGNDTSAFDPELLGAFKDTRQKRDGLVGRRVEVHYRRKNYGYQRKALSKSQKRFFSAAKAFMSRHTIDTATSPEYRWLEQAFKGLGEVNEKLDQAEQELQHDDKELNLRETELYEGEYKVYKGLSKMAGIKENTLPVDQIKQRPASSVRSTSTDATHPLARAFYDRAGEVKHLRETLHNLQVQHEQDLAIRDNQKELGRSVSPEKAFKDKYLLELTSIYRQLETAKKDADDLKRACLDSKVELEDEDKEDYGDRTEMLHLSLEPDRQMIHLAATQENSRQRSRLLGQFLSEYMDYKAKVHDWLTSVQQNSWGQDTALGTQNSVRDSIEPIETAAPATQSTVASKRGYLSSNERVLTEEREPNKLDAIDNDDLPSSNRGRKDDSNPGEFFALSQTLSEDGGHTFVRFAGDPPRRRYSDSGPAPPAPEHIVHKRAKSSDDLLNRKRDSRSL